MLLYHGTSVWFSEPSLQKCKPHRDFGCGFYLAQNYFDALPMAIKNSPSGYVYTYELDDIIGLKVLELNDQAEWLDFVVRSRLGEHSNYDLVIGKMAGGGANLKSKFSKYRMAGTSPDVVAAAMKKELTTTSLGIQYACLTPLAVSHLMCRSVETVEREDLA